MSQRRMSSLSNAQSPVSFGQLLRAQRRRLGLTQRQLSQAVACAEITLRKIEAGERGASPQLAQLLAEALKLEGVERERYISAALVQPIREPAQVRSTSAPTELLSSEIEPLATTLFLSYNDTASRALLTRLDAGIERVRTELRTRIHRDAQSALRLAGLLNEYWLKRNLLSEGRGWCEHALHFDATPTHERALALLSAGVLAAYQSDYTHAHARIEECLTIAPDIDAQGVYALIRPSGLHMLGWLGMQENYDRSSAVAYLTQAAETFEQIGQPLRAAHVRCDVTLAYTYCGSAADLDASRVEANRALAAFRTESNTFGEALALGMLAEAYLGADKPALAEPLARQALEAAQTAMYPHDIAWAHSRLSEICRLLGNTDEARQHAEQALPLFQQMGDQRAVCYRLQGLAQIARASGDIAEAKRRVAASLALAHELHSRPSVLRALSELVHVAIAEDRPLAVATFLGAIDARNAFLSDSLSRAQIAEIETEARAACAKAATDAMAQARERGQHLPLRGLIAFALT